MHNFVNSGSATAVALATPREARLSSEYRRIRHNISCIIAAEPHIVNLGPDPLVDQLLSAQGFDQREAFSLRVLISPQSDWFAGVARRTAIVVSSRAWHRGSDRRSLFELKKQASEQYRASCILVPQRALAGPIRLATAKIIAAARNVKCTTTERLRIIAHIHSVGWSSLSDCADQIRHADPAGVVLSMVANGDLNVDRSRPIGPYSRIDCNI